MCQLQEVSTVSIDTIVRIQLYFLTDWYLNVFFFWHPQFIQTFFSLQIIHDAFVNHVSVLKSDRGLTSQCTLRPVSCSRDQILWMRPACSGCMVVLPHIHWCFCIKESYTRPGKKKKHKHHHAQTFTPPHTHTQRKRFLCDYTSLITRFLSSHQKTLRMIIYCSCCIINKRSLGEGPGRWGDFAH